MRQAISPISDNSEYDLTVQSGRPAKVKRSLFGTRLNQAREAKGLSQRQVAEKIGIAQQTYAAWERRRSVIKPEDLVSLSEILDVDVNELLGVESPIRRIAGPTGKARKIFEQVSQLSRHQQQRILATVEDMLIAQESKTS